MVDVTKNIEYLMNVGREAQTVNQISQNAGRIVQDLQRNEETSYTNPVGAASFGARIQQYMKQIKETIKGLTPGQQGLKAGLIDVYANLITLEDTIKKYMKIPAVKRAVNDYVKGLYSVMR